MHGVSPVFLKICLLLSRTTEDAARVVLRIKSTFAVISGTGRSEMFVIACCGPIDCMRHWDQREHIAVNGRTNDGNARLGIINAEVVEEFYDADPKAVEVDSEHVELELSKDDRGPLDRLNLDHDGTFTPVRIGCDESSVRMSAQHQYRLTWRHVPVSVGRSRSREIN
ncbi:MAG: hypothetical protein J5J06_16115 [Phycisphaerae bacterium]|nr:hypothetical protein [Phycisphaerae bacterium]